MVSNPASASEDVQVAVSANTSGFDDAIGGAVESLQSLKGAAGIAGVAIAGLGTKLAFDAVQAAASFEDAILDLEKVAGEGVAQGLQDDIQQMAEEIPLTAEELAGLAEEAARFGIEGEENIKSFTRSTAEMAAATTLNSSEAASAFSRLSELTNTPVGEIENLGSSINTLSNNFATSSQEIVDASLRSAGALSQLGLSQTEIFGLTAALNEVSESSERAGTRLRRVGQEIQDANPEALAEPLGLSVSEFEQLRDEQPAELIQLLAERFAEGGSAADALRDELSTTSRQAVAGLAQNLEGLTDAQETSQQAFQKGTSLQEEFETETEKTSTQMELLSSKINNIKRDLGNDLLPAFNSILGVVSEGVNRFQKLNDRTDGMAAKAGLASSIVGGLALALGAVVSLIGGPLLAAVAAVAAAVGVLAVAWQNNWANIQGITEDVVGGLRDIITDSLDGIEALWSEHGDDITQSVNQLIAFLRFAWGSWGDSFVRTVRETLDFVLAFARPALEQLLNIIDLITDLIAGDWEGVWQSIKDITKTIIDGIIGILQESVDLFVAALKLIVDAFLTPFRAIWRALVGNSIVPEMLSDIVNTIINFVTPTENAVKKLAGAIVDGITGAVGSVASAAGTVAETIHDALPSPADMISLGESIVNGIADGLRDGVDAVADAAGDAADAISSRMPGSDAETGPLSDWTRQLEELGAGPARAIQEHTASVEQASEQAAEAASPDTSGGASRQPEQNLASVIERHAEEIVAVLERIHQTLERIEGGGTDRGRYRGALR